MVGFGDHLHLRGGVCGEEFDEDGYAYASDENDDSDVVYVFDFDDFDLLASVAGLYPRGSAVKLPSIPHNSSLGIYALDDSALGSNYREIHLRGGSGPGHGPGPGDGGGGRGRGGARAPRPGLGRGNGGGGGPGPGAGTGDGGRVQDEGSLKRAEQFWWHFLLLDTFYFVILWEVWTFMEHIFFGTSHLGKSIPIASPSTLMLITLQETHGNTLSTSTKAIPCTSSDILQSSPLLWHRYTSFTHGHK